MGKKSRSSREPRKPKQVKPLEDKASSLAQLVKSRAGGSPVGAK